MNREIARLKDVIQKMHSNITGDFSEKSNEDNRPSLLPAVDGTIVRRLGKASA